MITNAFLQGVERERENGRGVSKNATASNVGQRRATSDIFDEID